MITEKRLKKIKRVAKNRQSGFVVVLEDVYDPHNASAVLRTCDTFGVKDVYFIFENQEAYDPKKVGKVSSASANKWVDIKTFESTKTCFSELKKQGYFIATTTLAKDSKEICDINFSKQKIALVLGNEHKGVSNYAQKHSDINVYIDQKGMVQSLNISVAAAIFIYEISKQRAKNNLYSPKEINKLIKDYSKR
jgi:tRNA (guanosine-2'-O-)-methyltransferase